MPLHFLADAVPPDPDEHTDQVARAVASLVAFGLAIGPSLAGAGPKRDGDSRDHGEFWSEVVSPHHDEVNAIKVQLRYALAVIAADWSPEHRERVIADATRTPWETENARLEGPGGLQLTLFSDAPPAT